MKRALLAVLVTACTGSQVGVAVQGDTNCPPDNPCCVHTPESPIILDLDGNGLELTGYADGVDWTLKPDEMWRWSWIKRGARDGFLVRDNNNDGWINDATEMFGNLTQQEPSDDPNGFAALSWYDAAERGGNADGRLDSADSVWPSLMVWVDADHDGRSYGELVTLESGGVRSFDLRRVIGPVRRVDEHGNNYRFSAPLDSDSSMVASDVWLTPDPSGGDSAVQTWRCDAWVFAFDDPATTGYPIAPCSRVNVRSETVLQYGGRSTRLVARSSVGTTKNSVSLAAQSLVHAAVAGLDAEPCHWNFYDDDPFAAPPWYLWGSDYPTPEGGSSRVKCTRVTPPRRPNCE